MAFTEPSDGWSKLHFSVQLSLSASLTPQQCQRRGGNTGEERAAAVMLRTPPLKHSRGHSGLCQLSASAWTIPAADEGLAWDPWPSSVAFCGTWFVNVFLVLLKIKVFDWLDLSVKRCFWAGKNPPILFVSIQQMLWYLKGLFALSEGFHSLLLQGDDFKLWLEIQNNVEAATMFPSVCILTESSILTSH